MLWKKLLVCALAGLLTGCAIFLRTKKTVSEVALPPPAVAPHPPLLALPPECQQCHTPPAAEESPLYHTPCCVEHSGRTYEL